jgi:hypothetical protein
MTTVTADRATVDRDEKWDAPLTQQQWDAVKFMFEDRTATAQVSAA